MIKKPEANFPVEEGYVRHQFLLAIDNKTWDSWSIEKKVEKLLDFFGEKAYPFVEKVREDNDWQVWHLWADYKK
jgi:hypothetical protein